MMTLKDVFDAYIDYASRPSYETRGIRVGPTSWQSSPLHAHLKQGRPCALQDTSSWLAPDVDPAAIDRLQGIWSTSGLSRRTRLSAFHALWEKIAP